MAWRTLRGRDVEETVDGLPVLAEVRAVEVQPVGPIPAMQAAAVAATGFVAGAFAMAWSSATAPVSSPRRCPPAGYGGRAAGSMMRPVPQWPVGTSRTYLVNVRLIARSGE